MTSKEKRQYRNMEIRVEELERHLKIAQKPNHDIFTELYETRVAMRQAYEALIDAENVLFNLMREDPAFMEQWKISARCNQIPKDPEVTF